ncbi:MAG: fructosamine kinase family protein [Pseudomonadota bacterium]
MFDLNAIDTELSRLGLGSVKQVSQLGGGDTTGGYHLACDQGDVFMKSGPASYQDMFDAEADGLRELSSAGAIRVPRVLGCGRAGGSAFIALEFLPLDADASAADEELGEALATMHRATSDKHGWHRHNTIGLTPQPNPPTLDWIDFFASHRLEHQLRIAYARGHDGVLVSFGQRVLDRIADFFTAYAPSPSLLHGDLWSGNRACVAGEPVIFDPAVYFGDREADIAMTQLFGGFKPGFLKAYQASWPMADGHEVRSDLYRLYHVLNHLNLFGGSYYDQSVALCRKLLASV